LWFLFGLGQDGKELQLTQKKGEKLRKARKSRCTCQAVGGRWFRYLEADNSSYLVETSPKRNGAAGWLFAL